MKSVYHTPGEKKTEGKPLLFYGSTALWQGRQDSNLRHPVLETGALPTELLPCVLALFYMIFPSSATHFGLFEEAI